MTRLEEYEMFDTVWLQLHYFGRVLEEGILDKLNADGAPLGMRGGGLLDFEYFIIVKYYFTLPSLPNIN